MNRSRNVLARAIVMYLLTINNFSRLHLGNEQKYTGVRFHHVSSISITIYGLWKLIPCLAHLV